MREEDSPPELFDLRSGRRTTESARRTPDGGEGDGAEMLV